MGKDKSKAAEELTEEQIKEKQQELAGKIRTAPISEIANKIKDCANDEGKRCDEARFAVFLGAGASFQAKIKTAGQMMSEFREKILRRECPGIIDKKAQEKWLADNVFSKGDGNDYSKLLERFERTPRGRQTYISKLIKDKQPTFGYSMLASMVARGFINTVITTNFDDLMFIACTKFTGVRPVIYAYGIMATEMKFSAPHPKILKIHGDYLYSLLANTEREMSLYNQDPNMKAQVAHALNEYEMILFGYSGSDNSVMNILETYPGGKELYWCHWSKELQSLRALELLHEKDGTLVPIDGFDEAMYEIYKVVDFDLDAVLASYEERRSEVLKFIDEFDKKYAEPVITESIQERKLPKAKIEREPETWYENFETAYRASKNNNAKVAEKYYRKVIRLNPNFAAVYNNLGLLLEQDEKRWTDAEKIYRIVINKFPDNFNGYYNLGNLLVKNETRWKEAEELYNRALQIEPNSALTVNCLGFLFIKQGKYDDAVKQFTKSIMFDYKLAFPYINLASIYKRKNEKTNFLKYYQKSKQFLKPQDYYLWACLQSIAGNADLALDFLQKSVSRDNSRKLAAKHSPNFDFLRDDERFWKIVSSDDQNLHSPE